MKAQFNRCRRPRGPERWMCIPVLVFAWVTLLPTAAKALEDDPFSEDSLFGGEVVQAEEESADPGVDDLLTNDSAELGGQFEMTVRASADPEAVESVEDIAAEYTLRPTVYIDSRPDPSFRVFLKGEIDYTTVRDPAAAGANDGSGADTDGSGGFAQLSIEELFADITLSEHAYLRTGKQNMSWGVGYYFSPADLLSLETIDPDDPEAEREGPVAARVHLPWMSANAYGYVILDELPDSGTAGYAGKAELVVGNAELAAGGFYRADSVSGAMATYSGSIRDVDLFAEAALTYGSTITVVEDDGAALSTKDRTEQWFPSATAGLRYSWSDNDGLFSLSIVAEYLYNGEGYEDPTVLHDPRVDALLATGALTFADLRATGMHYGAASVRWSDAFGSKLTLSGLWIGNVSDGSGRVSADVAYAANDRLTLSAGYRYSYGEERDEYTPTGPGGSVSVTATIKGSW